MEFPSVAREDSHAGSTGRNRGESDATKGSEASVVRRSGTRRRAPRAPRVLVVDDERMVRRVLARMLDRIGVEVYSAANGVEALALLDSRLDGRVDLLVTDLLLPSGSGRALAERFRERLPELPVILVSGLLDPEPEASESGRVHFLTKPFGCSELCTLVERLVGSKRDLDDGHSA